MKIKKIKIPIYNAELEIIVGDTVKAAKHISNFDTIGDWEDLGRRLGKFIPCPEGCGFIFMKKYDEGILIHEILHYVTHLFDDKGIEISYSNDESMAYMIEYVYREFKKKDVKNEI